MSGYRDDLTAAQERCRALEREIAALENENARLADSLPSPTVRLRRLDPVVAGTLSVAATIFILSCVPLFVTAANLASTLVGVVVILGMCVPMLVSANHHAACVEVTQSGLLRRGLWRTFVPWDRVRRVEACGEVWVVHTWLYRIVLPTDDPCFAAAARLILRGVNPRARPSSSGA